MLASCILVPSEELTPILDTCNMYIPLRIIACDRYLVEERFEYIWSSFVRANLAPLARDDVIPVRHHSETSSMATRDLKLKSLNDCGRLTASEWIRAGES